MNLITGLFLKMMIIYTQLRMQRAGPDNKGTEYIIGYMENKGTDLSVDLYVTTMKPIQVNVHVKAPLYTPITIDEQFSITAGDVHKLSFDVQMRANGNNLTDKGICVTADEEVVIYGVNPEKFSNEAFLGLPTDILGTDYYIITWFPPTENCQLLVVGVNDSTTVTITLGEALDTNIVTWGGTNYNKGDSIVVNINRFQTLQLTSLGDLTGTHITSDKIIAVFSGNKKTNVGSGNSKDHLVEQWPPVSTFGKNFATVPMPGRTVGDFFKFVATEDNTSINVTGGNYSASFTIGLAGSHHQLDIPSGDDFYCYVQSDKPILLAQFCKSQQSSDEKSDPSMVMIPPIELYSADYTFSTPEYSDIGNYTNYFMFVAKDADKSGLLLDGGPFPGTVQYNPIPGTDLVGGHVEVSHGTHSIRHTSVISVFGGYVFGTANFETYAFLSGSRLAPINTVCVPSTTVIGDGYDNDCDGLIDEELCPDGNDEDGDGSADEDCAMPFPIDGSWTAWSLWGVCSVTCSVDGSLVSGFTQRTRTCDNPAPQYDGRPCEGHDNETTTCSTSSFCPVDGNWTYWSAWTSCSVTCTNDENMANGTIVRTRNCSEPVPQYGGNYCVGDGNETLVCSTTVNCPVDGNWTDWSAWSTCSVTCTEDGNMANGTSVRIRNCSEPVPQYGGNDCVGDGNETIVCSTIVNCPVDGNWTDWSAWSTCSVTCTEDGNMANGTSVRTRNCSEPVPQYGGNDCVGDGNETLVCSTTVNCPVDGNWTDWAPWSTCSVTCSSDGGEESGTSLRSRTCGDPVPQYNGTDCDGNSTESISCSTSTQCPTDSSGLSLALIAVIATLGLLALLATCCCCCWLLCAWRRRRKRKKKVKPKEKFINRLQPGYILYILGYDGSKGFPPRKSSYVEHDKIPITNANNATGYSGIGNTLYFQKKTKSTNNTTNDYGDSKSKSYGNDHASTGSAKTNSSGHADYRNSKTNNPDVTRSANRHSGKSSWFDPLNKKGKLWSPFAYNIGRNTESMHTTPGHFEPGNTSPNQSEKSYPKTGNTRPTQALAQYQPGFTKDFGSISGHVEKSSSEPNSPNVNKYGRIFKPGSSFHSYNSLNSDTNRQSKNMKSETNRQSVNSLKSSYSDPYITTNRSLKPGNPKEDGVNQPGHSNVGQTQLSGAKISKSAGITKSSPYDAGQPFREIKSAPGPTESVPRLHKTGYSKGSYYKTKISEPKHHKPRDFVPTVGTSF